MTNTIVNGWSVLTYVTHMAKIYGHTGIQGDFVSKLSGITYVDIEFPTVIAAAVWLDNVKGCDKEYGMPAIVGDIRVGDKVETLNYRVVVTVTVSWE